jgi:hypothetical protein
MNESCCSSGGDRNRSAFSGWNPKLPADRAVRKTGSALAFRDRLGIWAARWGIGRMRYRVEPGLYDLGGADGNSPVLVTANYRMTFDRLRSSLPGRKAWILVLDTRGINVWCAAGKGTFGTDELTRRIASSGLDSAVGHRTLILPQLGAPGVAAHEVRKRTRFKVVYGPVRAEDLPRFLDSNLNAVPDMRRVRFTLRDRLVLTPMEIVPGMKLAPILLAATALLRWMEGAVGGHGLIREWTAVIGSVLTGAFLFQVLLPWIPGRAFAFKGWLLGLVWAGAMVLWIRPAPWTAVSHLLILPALTAFVAMNFTGSTTFTSLSGVVKEMRVAVPGMIAAAVLGILARVLPRLIA